MASAEYSFREEISKLMGQGKRHLVCNEAVQAVKCFEEATQKLDTKHGPGADECGEAYLFYGKALLELARAENGVIGNALKDVEPTSEESSEDEEEKMKAVGPKISEMSATDKEKIREDVQDAMAEKEEGTEPDEKEKQGKDKDNKEENVDKSDEGTSKTKEEGKDQSTQCSKSEDAAPKDETDVEMKEEKENDKEKDTEEGVNKGEGNDGEEEESDEGEDAEGGEGNNGGTTTEGQEEDADADVPTMQLAWESLVLARVVFLRREKDAQLDIAEVHLKFGEIQLEQEQFVGAVTDFLKCLELQEKHLEPDDRLIAETAYNVGLAYSLQPNYTKAKEFYNKALTVIELKMSKLETRLAESEGKGKGKATDDNPSVVDRKELEELQNLYPEIKARVDEAQEMINSAANQPESTTEEGFGSSGQDKSKVPVNTIPIKKVSSQQPVNDVSHLIRRKRKPEEERSDPTEDSEVPVKKARQDEEPQTAAAVNENGHAQN